MAQPKRYFAKEPITHNGVLAYNVGDEVPDSNVRLYGYDKAGVVSHDFPTAAVADMTRRVNRPGVSPADPAEPAADEPRKAARS